MLSVKTKEKLIHPKYQLWTSIDEQICDDINDERGILGINLNDKADEKTDTDSVVLFLNFKYTPNKEFEAYYVVSYYKTEKNFFEELKKTRDEISVEEYATLYENILNEKDRKYIAKKVYETIDKTLKAFNIE